MRILIDPGHGGDDLGATWGDLYERDINQQVGFKLRGLLSKHSGMDTCLLRWSNFENISLPERRQAEKEFDADLVISIHTNMTGGDSQGAMGFWWPGNEPMAEMAMWISHRVPDELQRRRNEGFAAEQGVEWLKRARNVLGVYRAPTLLYEVGFLSDDDDREALVKPSVQWCLAAAMFGATARHYGTFYGSKEAAQANPTTS